MGQYFTRIGLPENAWIYDVSRLDAVQQLRRLDLIVQHHLASIPFENITLHYSTHRVININPKHLFTKIVQQSGRGGYCMEINTIMHTVLLTLGYDVYLAGARVFDNGKFGGLAHVLNIITIGEEQYVVDVGFGPKEPTHPIRLVPGELHQQISPATSRLRRGAIAQGVKRNEELWIYEIKVSAEAEWEPCYCFSEMEFLPEDMAVMNYWPQKDPASIFTQMILCVRFTWRDQTFDAPADTETERAARQAWSPVTGDEIDGTLILFGDKFKWRRGGELVFEKQLASEAERVSVLKEYFGIQLSEGEIESLRGTTVEIKPEKR